MRVPILQKEERGLIAHYKSPITNRPSVLKQVVKRRARVIWALAAFAGCFLFDHHAYGIQRAIVALVFGRNPGRDRLIAFEAARRIEMFALFAGMKIEPALRTLPGRGREIRQQRAAFRAARDGPRSRHVDGTRPERVLSFWRRGLLRLFFRATTGILIPVLPVFSVRQINSS